MRLHRAWNVSNWFAKIDFESKKNINCQTMDTTLIQIKVGQNKIVIVKNILYIKYAIGITSFPLQFV